MRVLVVAAFDYDWCPRLCDLETGLALANASTDPREAAAAKSAGSRLCGQSGPATFIAAGYKNCHKKMTCRARVHKPDCTVCIRGDFDMLKAMVIVSNVISSASYIIACHEPEAVYEL
jgi:hypothetical protein